MIARRLPFQTPARIDDQGERRKKGVGSLYLAKLGCAITCGKLRRKIEGQARLLTYWKDARPQKLADHAAGSRCGCRCGAKRVLARIIHEHFCCNRAFAAATSLRRAGSPLAPLTYCSSTPRGLAVPRARLTTRLRDLVPRLDSGP